MKSRVHSSSPLGFLPVEPLRPHLDTVCPSPIRGPAPREGDSPRAWVRAAPPSHAAPSQQGGCRWCEVSSDGSFSARLNRVWDQPPEPPFLRPSLRPGCSWVLLGAPVPPASSPSLALLSHTGLGFWALLAQTSLSGGSVLPHQGEPRPTRSVSLAASRSACGPGSGPLSRPHVTGDTCVPCLPACVPSLPSPLCSVPCPARRGALPAAGLNRGRLTSRF